MQLWGGPWLCTPGFWCRQLLAEDKSEESYYIRMGLNAQCQRKTAKNMVDVNDIPEATPVYVNDSNFVLFCSSSFLNKLLVHIFLNTQIGSVWFQLIWISKTNKETKIHYMSSGNLFLLNDFKTSSSLVTDNYFHSASVPKFLQACLSNP